MKTGSSSYTSLSKHSKPRYATSLILGLIGIIVSMQTLHAEEKITEAVGPSTNRWDIQSAIDRARDYFNNNRGRTNLLYEIVLPPEWITINALPGDPMANSKGLIKFDNIRPGLKNKLLIRGTGRYFNNKCKCEMSRTTLAFPSSHTNISGTNSSNIEFDNIHFTKSEIKVTQGTVQEIGEDHIVVRLHNGFPTLAPTQYGGICKPRDENYSTPTFCAYPDIADDKGHGKKIRKYRLDTDPTKPGGVNPVYLRPPRHIKGGVKWFKAKKDFSLGAHDRDWKIYTNPIEHKSQFEVGDPVGIKSKHGQHAYYFERGELIRGMPDKTSQSITFSRVQWTQEARGIFRGVHQVKVQNSYAGPDPFLQNRLGNQAQPNAVSYLSSSSGGPQIGSHDDYPANFAWNKYDGRVKGEFGGNWHVIYNNQFIRLGDDAIGLFHVGKKNYVLKNRIVDGPARSIVMLNRCKFIPEVKIGENNIFENSINSVFPSAPDVELITDYDGVRPPLHNRGAEFSDQQCNSWRQSLGL